MLVCIVKTRWLLLAVPHHLRRWTPAVWTCAIGPRDSPSCDSRRDRPCSRRLPEGQAVRSTVAVLGDRQARMSGPDADEAVLLGRLRGGDVTAPADLAQRFLEDTRRALSLGYPAADEQAVMSAAIDAVLGVAAHPERVDLSKGSLGRYLRMSARGDLRNALAASGQRRSREPSLEAVEVGALERNMYRSDPNADPTAEAGIRAASRDFGDVDLHKVVSNSRELAVLRAMLEGERHTQVFAEILGIEALDDASQRAEVKKVKDRLSLRLRRLRGGAHE